jgi:hypothetical protein
MAVGHDVAVRIDDETGAGSAHVQGIELVQTFICPNRHLDLNPRVDHDHARFDGQDVLFARPLIGGGQRRTESQHQQKGENAPALRHMASLIGPECKPTGVLISL